MAHEHRRHLITLDNPRSPIAESYRTLRTNMQFAGVAKDLRSVLVTSAGPGEGKTTTIANLAVVTAQSEKRVLLVDADLRKPKLHHQFRLSNRWGLTHVLTGQVTLADAVQAVSGVERLSVLTSGIIPPNPAELLGSKVMQDLLAEAEEHFDMVLVDTPPVLAVTDAQVLSSLVDGVILVLSSGMVTREAALKAKQALEMVNANLLGVVLNRRKFDKEHGYYYYYYAE